MNNLEPHHELKPRAHTKPSIVALVGFAGMIVLNSGAVALAADNGAPAGLKPVASTGSGLLLEPPVDLSQFSREQFTAISASIGVERINKEWTSAVTPLPPHARPDVHGLTAAEVNDYMLQARRLFDAGAAIPVSDVGLVSTQEDVIRRPMFNHVSVFSNAVAHVYLLVQKTVEGEHWGIFFDCAGLHG